MADLGFMNFTTLAEASFSLWLYTQFFLLQCRCLCIKEYIFKDCIIFKVFPPFLNPQWGMATNLIPFGNLIMLRDAEQQQIALGHVRKLKWSKFTPSHKDVLTTNYSFLCSEILIWLHNKINTNSVKLATTYII